MKAKKGVFGDMQADDLWSADMQNVGKAPLIIGLILVGVLVIGVVAWQYASGAFGSAVYSVESQDDAEPTEGDSATVATGLIYVHVVGAVNAPGVYALAANARVYDAIAAAGGATDGASADALNLARVVSDGEQIRVPTIDEAQSGADASESTDGQAGTMIINGKVNINAADSETLQTLSGIGESTAQKIIADRQSNGPFANIEDLKRVSGIGDKKFSALADSICVG